MVAKVITVAIQKGGSGKTTTTGMLAHLLSQEYKVLAVDMDSQGNLSEMLTEEDDIYIYEDRTILEALMDRDARNYITEINDNLHIMTSTDLLSTFASKLYTTRGLGYDLNLVLSDTLETVKDRYDYILIDTPPALGELTINSLCASDHVIIMFETSKFCYSALGRFITTLMYVKTRVNPNVKIAGILRTLIDARRSDNKALIKMVEEKYEDMVFDTIITRKASVGRVSIDGFKNNSELSSAVKEYKDFLKELMERVG